MILMMNGLQVAELLEDPNQVTVKAVLAKLDAVYDDHRVVIAMPDKSITMLERGQEVIITKASYAAPVMLRVSFINVDRVHEVNKMGTKAPCLEFGYATEFYLK